MSFPSIYFDGYYRVLSHQLSPVDDSFPYFAESGQGFSGTLQEIDMSWEGHRILNQNPQVVVLLMLQLLVWRYCTNKDKMWLKVSIHFFIML